MAALYLEQVLSDLASQSNKAKIISEDSAAALRCSWEIIAALLNSASEQKFNGELESK
jgi:hypothetical protein